MNTNIGLVAASMARKKYIPISKRAFKGLRFLETQGQTGDIGAQQVAVTAEKLQYGGNYRATRNFIRDYLRL